MAKGLVAEWYYRGREPNHRVPSGYGLAEILAIMSELDRVES